MDTLKKLLLEGSGTPWAEFCMEYVLNLPQFSKQKWKSVVARGHKKIGSTSSTSDHADGNAIDWHGANGKFDPVMQQLATFLSKNAKFFNAKYIIYNKKIWSSSQGWHTYVIPRGGSAHEDHVHIDFKRTPFINPLTTAANINKELITIINRIYNVTTAYPEKYFEKYRSWNPVRTTDSETGNRSVSGDDEEGAAAWFKSWYSTNIQSKLDSVLPHASTEDLTNVRRILYVIRSIYNSILRGDSWTNTVNFYKFDTASGKYIPINLKFNWDYI